MARIQFYKPNPKTTGSACSFWSNIKEGSLFGSFIKQSSWNDKTKTGSFKSNKENPSASTQFKFNQNEVAAIIDCIETDREFSAYHSTPKQVTRFKFTHYSNSKGRVGFSYSVNKEDKEDSTNKASFVIGLTFAEARLLIEYLLHTLSSMFKYEDDNYSQTANTDKKLEQPKNDTAPKVVKHVDVSDVLEDDENW